MTTTTIPEAPLEGIILSAEPESALVAIGTAARPLDLFTTPGVVPALVARIRQAAFEGFEPSLASDRGRKEIASRAYRVTRAKTALDDLGKEEVARLKELPKAIDAGRKALRDALDALAEEIRQPLTAWEARRKELSDRLAAFQNLPARLMSAPSAELRAQLEVLKALDTTETTWGEFAGEAQAVVRVTLLTLEEMAEKAEKAEADAAELARLQAEKAERDRLDREEQLRREGEERARAAAAVHAPAQALSGVIIHEGNVQPVPQAVPLSPVPVQPAPAAADLEHRRTFNREAMADLEAVLGTVEGAANVTDAAKAVLTAIVTGKVRHVAINYGSPQ